MDAIRLLMQDHAEVEALFKRFEQLGQEDEGEKRQLVDWMIEDLSKHAAVEEQLLYPALRERAKNHDQDELALEALEEHHVAKWLLHELIDMHPDDERFDAKVYVLTEVVRHHVREEQNEVFPLIRRLYSRNELEEMGTMLEDAKRMAPTRPHPRAPDEPPGNLIAGPLAGMMDRGRSMMATRGVKSAPRTASAREARRATSRKKSRR